MPLFFLILDSQRAIICPVCLHGVICRAKGAILPFAGMWMHNTVLNISSGYCECQLLSCLQTFDCGLIPKHARHFQNPSAISTSYSYRSFLVSYSCIYYVQGPIQYEIPCSAVSQEPPIFALSVPEFKWLQSFFFKLMKLLSWYFLLKEVPMLKAYLPLWPPYATLVFWSLYMLDTADNLVQAQKGIYLARQRGMWLSQRRSAEPLVLPPSLHPWHSDTRFGNLNKGVQSLHHQ